MLISDLTTSKVEFYETKSRNVVAIPASMSTNNHNNINGTNNSNNNTNTKSILASTEVIAAPDNLTNALWLALARSFNCSQLFAIKYVSQPFEKQNDLRISLVQGPVRFIYIFYKFYGVGILFSKFYD